MVSAALIRVQAHSVYTNKGPCTLSRPSLQMTWALWEEVSSLKSGWLDLHASSLPSLGMAWD